MSDIGAPEGRRGADDAAGASALAVRVRYGDCDMQGVVFNPVYLSYVDDAVDVWFRRAIGSDYLSVFEYQLKKATIEWFAPARPHDTVVLRPHVTHGGTTSLHIRVDLYVAEQRIAVSDLVLVSVTPDGHRPCPVPDEVRAALAAS